MQVDRELQSEILLHFDISVATPCEQLVVGVMDAGGQKELLNHLVHPESIVWRFPDKRPNVEGCRLKADIPLNKVTGELIILPKAGMMPGPYGRILLFIDKRVLFAHLIGKFSLGPGGEEWGRKYFKNPLEGAYQPSMDRDQRFTYKLSVVPTRILDGNDKVKMTTNQYSVVGLKSRKDDPNVILPGLYFSYDLEPLVVCIKREYRPFIWFIVSVLGIIGGIYTCSGLIHHCVHHIYVYYIASRNAFRQRYLGALDGHLPAGMAKSISYQKISTSDPFVKISVN